MVMLLQHQMKQHQQVHEELREINELYQKSKVWLHGYHNCTYKCMQFHACHLPGMCIHNVHVLYIIITVAVWVEGR